MPTAHLPDHALEHPEIATFERAAGRCCRPAGCAQASATRHAPSAITRHGVPGSLTGAGRWRPVFSGEQLALYMRNRALAGPEKARQYRTYIAARAAAIEVLAPFYRSEFGRTPVEAKRFAKIYSIGRFLTASSLTLTMTRRPFFLLRIMSRSMPHKRWLWQATPQPCARRSAPSRRRLPRG